MSLTAEPADPAERDRQHLPPKSYADALEEALLHDDAPAIDEEAVKETPPRKPVVHTRNTSEPRAFGDALDEIERSSMSGSPQLRHTRGRLESKGSRESHKGKEDSSVAQEVTNGHSAPADDSAPNGHKSIKKEGKNAANGKAEKSSDTFDGVGEDCEPRTPTRKTHRRMSSRSSVENNENLSRSEQLVNGSQDKHLKQGSQIYESLRNKSGENLASIKPPAEAYQMSLTQREDKTENPDASRPTAQLTRQNSLVSGRRAGAGWSNSAIRWAPMNVPLQRRLQTLMVLAHTISIVGLLALFFLICAVPLSWPLVVPYLIYLTFSRAAVDGKLAHRSEWLRSSRMWSLFGAYFPARLHRSAPLEPTRKYIFGYHPHGIISHGAFVAFATEALGFRQLFPGITNTLLTLEANFSIPLYRDWALRLGLASVSRESCENLLTRGGRNGEGMGRAITIVIGGARESLDAIPYTLKLVLRKRKGFVKLAIRTGADLVPVLSFGENDIYDQLDGESHPFIHKAQLLVKKFMGFTIPLFHARGVFNYDVGIMPYRRPINIVVGKPIRVNQAAHPDPAYVDQIHAQYVEELLNIWETWKDDFAPDRAAELEIME